MKNNLAKKDETFSRRAPVINPANIIEAEYTAKVWRVTLDPGVEYEDALSSAFWTPVARQMNLDDEIKLRNSAGTLFAWLIVTSSDPSRGLVEVAELLKKDLTPANGDPYSLGDLIGQWEGPATRWVVRRKEDNVVLGRGIANRSELIRMMHTDFSPRAVS